MQSGLLGEVFFVCVLRSAGTLLSRRPVGRSVGRTTALLAHSGRALLLLLLLLCASFLRFFVLFISHSFIFLWYLLFFSFFVFFFHVSYPFFVFLFNLWQTFVILIVVLFMFCYVVPRYVCCFLVVVRFCLCLRLCFLEGMQLGRSVICGRETLTRL